MSDLEVGLMVFSMVFFFLFLLRDWHSQRKLTGGDVCNAMLISIMFGIIFTPIILVSLMFQGLAMFFNKVFSKL